MKLRPKGFSPLPWFLLMIAIAIVLWRLRSLEALLPLLRPWAEIGTLALGMTAVILTGGIDLSVGSIMGLTGVVVGLLWQRAGWSMPLAGLAGLATGFLAGAVNATLILSGIAPLVVTLATMAAYAGLAMALSRGERISGFPEDFTALGQGEWLGLPSQFFLFLVALASTGLLIHKTIPGRRLFAVGQNRLAAEFAAVPVRKLEWWLYTLNGFLAGCVSLWYTARRGAAVADAGTGLELQVIACVVLGGTRVTGGSGGVGATLLGLLILSHLEIGLRLWGSLTLPWTISGRPIRLDANARLIVIGCLILLVAVINERTSSRQREVT